MALQVQSQPTTGSLNTNNSGGLQVYDSDTLARLNDAIKSGADPSVAKAQALQYQAKKGSVGGDTAGTYTVNTLKDKLLQLLPAAAGTIGAIGGGVLTAGLGGEVAGGAGGAAYGELLRQAIESPGGKANIGSIATQGAIGGAGSLVGAGIGAAGKALGLNEVLGNILTKSGIGKGAGELAGREGAQSGLRTTEATILPNTTEDTVNALRQRFSLGSDEKPTLALPANSSQGITLSPTTKAVIRDNLAGTTKITDRGFTLPGESNVSYPSVTTPTPRTPIPEVTSPSVESAEGAVSNTVADNISEQPTGTLTKLGNSLRARVLNPDVASSPYGALGEQSLVDAQRTEGLSGTAANQYSQLPDKMNTLSTQIGEKLATNTNTIPSKDVLDNVFSKIDDNPSVLGDKGAVQDAKQIIQQKFDATVGNKADASAQDIVNFKQALGENASKLFSKSAKGQPLTQAEQAYLTAWQSVDSTVNKVAPEVKDLTLRQSNLYKMSGGLDANRGKGVINIPFVKNVGASAQQAFTDKTGSLLQRVGGSEVNKVINKPGLVGALGQVIGHGLTKYSHGDTTQGPQSSVDITDLNNQSQTQPSNTTDGSSNLTPDLINKLTLADLATTGGKNLAKIQALQSIMGNNTKSTQLSTSDQTRHDALQSAFAALDSAETNLDTAGGAKGPILGRLETLPLLGQYTNPAGTSYNDTKTEIATEIAKAITGGSRANESVVQGIMTSLPDVNDTPAFAKAKLDKLRNDLLKQASSFNYSDLIQNNQ